ncbi:MAG: HTH domain-containing protein [Bacilli bacterium]|nr:HTH domain-containing protein [Bacilli bacterium]
MEERDYYIILYDLYSSLFSMKQREYFEDYYFNNLSLSEISENVGVSRNAIHKSIKSIEKKLLFYEDNLKLYKKNLEVNNIIKNINDKNIRKKLEGIFYE